VFQQLEEQTEKSERLEGECKTLRRENTDLRKENKRLSERLDALEASIPSMIQAAVDAATKTLLEAIASKDAEIERLKAQINKDSSNSSKPPSSDGYKVVANNREKSGKKPGGQVGHAGHRLDKPKNWKELVDKNLAVEEVVDHTDGSVQYETRSVFDIGEITLRWTEHRYHIGAAELRVQAQPVVYGEHVKALVVMLAANHVAQERACAFIREITHGAIRLMGGTFNRIVRGFSERLTGELSAIKTDLLNGPVMHTDETPVKTTQWEEPGANGTAATLMTSEGRSVQANIRTYSNARSTLLTVNRHKDMSGVDRDGILGMFHGILVHDHDKKLYNYADEHATCGEHLTRDLKGLADGYGCEWASRFRTFLLEMNQYKKADIAQSQQMPPRCGEEQYETFSRQYDTLLAQGELAKQAQGNQYAQDELRKMLERLRLYKNCYLLFMKNYIAPFTNNQAERDLRPCKGKLKVSGCFRSWAGLVAFTRIRSFLSTLRKRALPLLPAVRSLFLDVPVFP